MTADGIRLVAVGKHTLAVQVRGTGEPVVVIEPSFGGAARWWTDIAERLAGQSTVITYDRAPYGASSAARDRRTPAQIAADLDGLLGALGVCGPLVLVGHSAGGIYVRTFAAAHPDRVAGMVLVESSHEGQRAVLDPLWPRRDRLRTALAVPSMLREPRATREGADKRSMIREWRTFRRVSTNGYPALPPGSLGQRPLVVLTCGPSDTAASLRVWPAWRALHADLAGLSANSQHVVSASPEHLLYSGDPELIIAAVTEVVRCARSGGPLAPLASPVTGAGTAAASDAE